jgi:hypothetical protein
MTCGLSVHTKEVAAGMKTRFTDAYKRRYSSLSIRDLLDARDAYHVHLSHKQNVIATAIGKYLIRNKDVDSKQAVPADRAADRDRNRSQARRFDNARVQPWSWPCVLVFVENWMTREEIGSHPEEVVPPFLYLPDGRVVPVCVVEAPIASASPIEQPVLRFPDNLMGGGYPVVTEVQGRDHISSVACLVTDGQLTYALTNQHVAGEPASPIYTYLAQKRVRIGAAHGRQLGKRSFEQVYRGWPGNRTFCNLDAALVRVDDIGTWTAQTYGIGELGPIVDLHPDTLTIDWIGCPLRAFGAASGQMEGQIQALFYRYRSLGGFDYVSDLLISARDGKELLTRPGDSGTMWFFDEQSDLDKADAGNARRFRPLALQWGGHRVMASGGEQNLGFALATLATTVCRELDVDIVQDFNTGQPEYWGAVGHYKIGQKAVDIVKNQKLKAFLTKNLDRIAYSNLQIQEEISKKNPAPTGFVGLADVPDVIWKAKIAGLPRPLDKPSHYANMDMPGFKEFKGETLRSICGNPISLDITKWVAFYADVRQNPDAGRVQSGALPFRVWQIYDDMVAFAMKGKLADFLCAAGILAHYVGDACQPLHGSQFSDGRGTDEEGVHSAFETKMPNRAAVDLNTRLDAMLKNKKPKLVAVTSGHVAAIRVVNLMDRVAQILPPQRIFESYRASKRPADLWTDLGQETLDCMLEGCKTLAAIWQGAWEVGNGGAIPVSKLKAIDKQVLRNRYENKTFLESRRLEDMAKLEQFQLT